MSDKKKPPATVYEDDDGPMPAGNAAMPPRPAPIQPMGTPGMIQPMGRGGFGGGGFGGGGAAPQAARGGGPKTRLDEDDEVVERLMGFFVIIKSKMDEEHRYFRLRRGINFVGRFGSRAQVELRDNLVSEQHAIIVCTNTATRYVDLDSSNGSVVNGEKSEYAELSEGDTVAVGSTTLMFVPFPFVAED
jgi:hypothetical protein